MAIGRAQLPAPRRRIRGQRRTGNALNVNSHSISQSTVLRDGLSVHDTTPLMAPAPVIVRNIERELSTRAPRTYFAVAIDVTGTKGRRRDVIRLLRHWTSKLGLELKAEPVQAEGGRFWYAVDGSSEALKALCRLPFIVRATLAMEGAVPSAAPTMGRKRAAPRSSATKPLPTKSPMAELDRIIADNRKRNRESSAELDCGGWAGQSLVLPIAERNHVELKSLPGFDSCLPDNTVYFEI
jgi:hypothetical protein